jgi:hypothetical protein
LKRRTWKHAFFTPHVHGYSIQIGVPIINKYRGTKKGQFPIDFCPYECLVMALDPIIYGGDNAYDEAGDGDAVLLLQPLAPKLE